MPKTYLKKNIFSKQINPADFLKFASGRQKGQLLKISSLLKGKKIVHVSATRQGGGVAELLESLVPYLRSLQLESQWYYINPSAAKEFFVATNKIHNALQGSGAKISRAEWDEYEETSRRVAKALDKINCDILVLHDPQVLLAGAYSHFSKHKIFFCHIDTTSAKSSVRKKIFSIINSYQSIVFSNIDFVRNNFSPQKLKIFTPAIDPLSPKQKIFSKKQARNYLKKNGAVPAGGPLIVQVSRFDIWKNPLGVVKAFAIVQKKYPEARLAMLGFNEASDNPLSAGVYNKVAALAKKNKGIFLFFNPMKLDVLKFTAMAQNAADVVVQNSVKEGFGLTVAEAMWKGKAVVGGPASGIQRQISNGKNGFIARGPEELAEKIIFLLGHSESRKKIGKAARQSVLKKFLFPRFVLDHLKLYKLCLKQ